MVHLNFIDAVSKMQERMNYFLSNNEEVKFEIEVLGSECDRVFVKQIGEDKYEMMIDEETEIFTLENLELVLGEGKYSSNVCKFSYKF